MLIGLLALGVLWPLIFAAEAAPLCGELAASAPPSRFTSFFSFDIDFADFDLVLVFMLV